MSREVEEMRRSFEDKLQTFSQAQAQFEQEKRSTLEELKAQHRQEIQELLRSHQSQNANYSKDQEKLGQLHKAEVTSGSENPLLKGTSVQYYQTLRSSFALLGLQSNALICKKRIFMKLYCKHSCGYFIVL